MVVEQGIPSKAPGRNLQAAGRISRYIISVLLRSITRPILDFCFPGACAVCNTSCESDVPLCEKCRIDLAALESAPACPFCGKPIKEVSSPCPYCKGDGVPHFQRVMRLGVFDDPLKELIHQMKYRRGWNLGEFLADRLLDQERVKGLLTETQIIVPVPLFFTRHIMRGYNQSEIIARRLAKQCGIPLVKALTRVRSTETQTHLSPTQRVENLRGAFAPVKPKKITGKHVVIVDDVITTGATLQTAARTLAQAKPASLCALSLAIADPKGRSFEAI